MKKQLTRVGIVAGETSGDQLAAELILAIKKKYPDVIIEGLAGPKMIKAGCKPIINTLHTDVMGFHQVIKKIFSFLTIRNKLIKHFKLNPPDLFIGVDFTEFNLSLARKLKKLNIKTIQYKGPSVWAWREGRVKRVQKYIDLVLTIFPFEQRYYDSKKINSIYVGHQLSGKIPFEIDPSKYRRELNLPLDKKILAILPGSRSQEIETLAKPFLQTMDLCARKDKELIFVCAHISEEKAKIFNAILNKSNLSLPLKHIINNTHSVLGASDIVLLASGTATLETMLFKKPMVVAYKISKIYEIILKKLLKIKYISIPNLLANKLLVPEMLQKDVEPSKLCKAIFHILNDDTYCHSLKKEFYKLHKELLFLPPQQMVELIENIL